MCFPLHFWVIVTKNVRLKWNEPCHTCRAFEPFLKKYDDATRSSCCGSLRKRDDVTVSWFVVRVREKQSAEIEAQWRWSLMRHTRASNKRPTLWFTSSNGVVCLDHLFSGVRLACHCFFVFFFGETFILCYSTCNDLGILAIISSCLTDLLLSDDI